MHDAEISERPRVLRSHGQNLDQGRLSRREWNGSIVGEKIGTHVEVNYRGAYHRFDVAGIERQGSFKKTRACVRYLLVSPLCKQALP